MFIYRCSYENSCLCSFCLRFSAFMHERKESLSHAGKHTNRMNTVVITHAYSYTLSIPAKTDTNLNSDSRNAQWNAIYNRHTTHRDNKDHGPVALAERFVAYFTYNVADVDMQLTPARKH